MSYPLGIDNPIKVKQDYGSHTWSLYWKDNFQKIATFSDQFTAYEYRRVILENTSDPA